jgi:hypothetical protein
MLLNGFYQLLLNIASNARHIMSDKFGSGHGLYSEIIQNLSGWSEAKYKNPQSEFMVPELKLKPESS